MVARKYNTNNTDSINYNGNKLITSSWSSA